MRTLTKLVAVTAVLLAMVGCTSGPKPASSEPQGPAGSHDAVSTDAAAGDFESQPTSTKKHLLAEEGGYKFYSLVPADPEKGRLCVIVQSEGAPKA